MARSTVVWSGLEEYREQLRQLPEACTGEAAHVVEAGANSAYQTISAVYGAHRYTGNLQKRLTLSALNPGRFATGLVLRSGSPIAWLFDNGSQARHKASGASTGQMWGRTPPTHIFARTVGRTKRTIVQQLKDMVLRRGATSVTGEGE